MNVETVICAYDDSSSYGKGCYGAFAILDGVLTDWDCTHLHHSARAARKCLSSTRRRVEDWLGQPGVTITPLPASETYGAAEGLYEIEFKEQSDYSSRFLSHSRRFRMPYDGAAPVAEIF